MIRFLFTYFLTASVLVVNGQSFYGEKELPPSDQAFLSQSHLDSLIQAGDYYLVNRSCADFRYCACSDSLSKRFHFKLKWVGESGCEPNSKAVTDTINTFNDMMYRHITTKNGAGWERRYDSLVKVCANGKCFQDNEIDSFVTWDLLSGVSLFFDHKKSRLNEKLTCAISHIVLPMLKKYPKIKAEVKGYSSYDELDSNHVLSANRAAAVRKYLISQGIPENRIVVIKNKPLNNLGDKKHVGRRFRMVNIAWTY